MQTVARHVVRLHINAATMEGSTEATSLLETVGKLSAGSLAADALELEAQYLEQHNEMPLSLLKRYIAYCRRFALQRFHYTERTVNMLFLNMSYNASIYLIYCYSAQIFFP